MRGKPVYALCIGCVSYSSCSHTLSLSFIGSQAEILEDSYVKHPNIQTFKPTHLGGGDDVIVGRVGGAVLDVIAERSGEQHGLIHTSNHTVSDKTSEK
jgi:hypothetical protein